MIDILSNYDRPRRALADKALACKGMQRTESERAALIPKSQKRNCIVELWRRCTGRILLPGPAVVAAGRLSISNVRGVCINIECHLISPLRVDWAVVRRGKRVDRSSVRVFHDFDGPTSNKIRLTSPVSPDASSAAFSTLKPSKLLKTPMKPGSVASRDQSR